MAGTFSVALLATVASAPARLVSAAFSLIASASSGPLTASLAEPPMPAAWMPSASSVAATLGCAVGLVTRAFSTARPTAVPGMPAWVASRSMVASLPSRAASAVTDPLTAWPVSARKSSSRVMRRLTLPSGRAAPLGSVAAPSACRLFQSARWMVACSVPSAVRLATRSRVSGAPSSVPCAVTVPAGLPGSPVASTDTCTGPFGTPLLPIAPASLAATARLSVAPLAVPCTRTAPSTVGVSTARSLSAMS